MKNIACEPRGVQRGIRAFLPRTNCPFGDNAAKLKACCGLPVLQPEPLPFAMARRQTLCSEERAPAALPGSGTSDIRCRTAVQHSILPAPAPVASRGEGSWPGIKMLSMPGQSSPREFQAPDRLSA